VSSFSHGSYQWTDNLETNLSKSDYLLHIIEIALQVRGLLIIIIGLFFDSNGFIGIDRHIICILYNGAI
jgi:hypothetical protein